jgi:hypothetical protein
MRTSHRLSGISPGLPQAFVTLGDPTQTLTPRATDSYYLVASRGLGEEGSFGIISAASRVLTHPGRPQAEHLFVGRAAKQLFTPCP